MATTRIHMLTKNLGLIAAKSKLANIKGIRTFSIFDFWRNNNNTNKINHVSTPIVTSMLQIRQSRSLFTEEVLRLEPFVQRRDSVMREYSEGIEKFFTRLESILQNEDKAIYSNDLSTAIYLCDGSERHLKILIDIVEHLLLKTKEETPYPHYSVIRNANPMIQLLHHINRPDLVIELFMNQERFPNLLEIIPTLGLEVAVDLLERNSNHQEIIDIYEAFMERTRSERIPLRLKDVLISVINSLYKLGTPEAYHTGMAILTHGTSPPNFRIRTHTPIALMALKFGETPQALDLLLPTFAGKSKNYISVYNMRIKALLNQDRVDEALVILKNLTEQSALFNTKYSLASDVMEAFKTVVEGQNNPDIVAKFTDLTEQLKNRDCLSSDTLDEIMLSLMKKPLSKPRPSNNMTQDGPDRRGRFDHSRQNSARGPGFGRSNFSGRSNNY